MDINAIHTYAQASLSDNLTFPELIDKLAPAGVERYLVDLVGKQKISFGMLGESLALPMNITLQPIPHTLDAMAMKTALVDVQQRKITYPVFLDKIMTAGCCHYEVFVRGKKVIYFGRDGTMHIEPFQCP